MPKPQIVVAFKLPDFEEEAPNKVEVLLHTYQPTTWSIVSSRPLKRITQRTVRLLRRNLSWSKPNKDQSLKERRVLLPVS